MYLQSLRPSIRQEMTALSKLAEYLLSKRFFIRSDWKSEFSVKQTVTQIVRHSRID